VHAEVHATRGNGADDDARHPNRNPPQRAAAREEADDDGQESVERDRGHHMAAGERVTLTVDEAFEVRPRATDNVLEYELEQGARGRRDQDRNARGTAATPRQEDQQRTEREYHHSGAQPRDGKEDRVESGRPVVFDEPLDRKIPAQRQPRVVDRGRDREDQEARSDCRQEGAPVLEEG